MIWEDSNLLLGESKVFEDAFRLDDNSSTSTNIDQNDRKNQVQLKKFTDPKKDTYRRSLLDKVDQFSRLLKKNQREEIDKTLMSEDCLVFVLNFDKNSTIRYSSKLGEGINKIYPNIKVLERQVLENYVDVQKNTVIQTSRCLIWNQEDDNEEGSMIERVTCDLFTIKDHKISKYRVFFGVLDSCPENNPFTMNNKERMIVRIKEINYVLCGLPDIENVASLLDEETEYKICSWDQQNCYVSNKYNLKSTFDQLQETMQIIRIIPYDFSLNGSKVQANYVYYLQDKRDGKQYLWLTNCIYLFDEELKIAKILQMGEFVSEEDTAIPFEAFSVEETIQRIFRPLNKEQPTLDLFYEDKVKLECTYFAFGNEAMLPALKIKFDKLLMRLNSSNFNDSHWRKMVDVYIDENSPGYEAGIFIGCEEWKADPSGQKDNNIIRFNKIYFENRRVCKVVNFYVKIYEPIPSLFDDSELSALNIITAKDFYQV